MTIATKSKFYTHAHTHAHTHTHTHTHTISVQDLILVVENVLIYIVFILTSGM